MVAWGLEGGTGKKKNLKGGWSNNTADRILALHVASPSLIPGTILRFPKSRDRSKPLITAGSDLKTKREKKKKRGGGEEQEQDGSLADHGHIHMTVIKSEYANTC